MGQRVNGGVLSGKWPTSNIVRQSNSASDKTACAFRNRVRAAEIRAALTSTNG